MAKSRLKSHSDFSSNGLAAIQAGLEEIRAGQVNLTVRLTLTRRGLDRQCYRLDHDHAT